MLDKRYTEEELVVLLKTRNRIAFNYLYNSYGAALFSVLKQYSNQEHETADILQESFIKIWRNIDQYDSKKGRLYTWMVNIARNQVIDYMRSAEKNRNKRTEELKSEHQYLASQMCYLQIDYLGLPKILTEIRTDYRKIIDLAYFSGLSHNEIAKELNLPLGTVKTSLRQGLRQIRTSLTAAPGEAIDRF